MRAALFLTAALSLSSVIQAQPASRPSAAPNAQKSVPQTGSKADQLRENLKKIKLPPGFKIELYAVVPDARQMAVGNKAGIVFVGTTKDDVWAVTSRTQPRVPKVVEAMAPSVTMKNPNGVCTSKDGVLYVVEDNRVLAFPNAESSYGRPDAAFQQVYDRLVPPTEISHNHGARVCRVGPDNKLYITLGQPYNVPPVSKRELYSQWGMGGIIRMNRDGKSRETYVEGIRNSVGVDFNPRTGELWFTDNQVDGMGDDQPPEELNRVTRQGQNFGFPWYGGGHVRTLEYKDQTPPADVTFPEVELPAHAAALGLTFYRGQTFPERYRTAGFIAQHGSFNRTKPIGARVSVVFFKKDGTVDKVEVFAQGWLDDETGEYSGRPVDVAELADGSLLVSDDFAGAIYRISYGEK
jgi:glucose/arabinose dehydrogenase